ncbi:MAG: class I SAM-dependent methyltransferase [Halorhabdus sp.]
MGTVESFVRFCDTEFGTAVMDREAAYIRDHVATDDLILDVGCGIGSLEERFLDHDIVGVDRSEAMIRAARSRASAPFVIGDATALPITSASVDIVSLVATLEFVPDVDAALAEATRVLRPDGALVALVLNTRSTYVQTNLERAGSYFQRMVHRDTADLERTIRTYVDGETEPVLGVSDTTVVPATESETAAVIAIAGTPVS